MGYTMVDIFNQAESDDYSVKINGNGYKSVILYGIKAVRDDCSGEVTILDIKNKMLYYSKLSDDDADVFLENGWRLGVYYMTLNKYRSKLDLIERKINESIKSKKPKKTIDQLKSERLRVIDRYSEVSNKINKTKSNGKD